MSSDLTLSKHAVVPGRRKHRPGRLAPYIFISPFYIIFAIFFVFPIGFAIVLSFNMWDQATPMHWIGLNNFTHLFIDPYFGQAVFNTLVYMLGSLFISFFLSLPLALGLNSPRVYGKAILRVLYFSPIVTPAVAITIVFSMIYNKDFGVLNALLGMVGIHPIPWLDSTTWSKVSVLGLTAWQWTGMNALYFLAGLQSIPMSLYEAGALDGANNRQLIRHITLPGLAPMMLFVLITTFIGSSQIFDQPFILTGGGPLNSSMSYANYLYEHGLSYLHLGYAAAMGVLLFIVVTIISALQYRRLNAE